ncbi:acetamidase/formamidase family protein [Labedaea rhizosphaerae]|uniref:Acetamidase/formamidase n=1 Tax=Labedaea rhizosphaerae TaxID=598644 RepID=A0A4R6SJI0_LABRH|nr:acetamidase/formamidase family protein [Labedaea rhizosphaerae]TDQ01546.1 acetamidase/formamidase [Labedaea rhizosphaerae]
MAEHRLDPTLDTVTDVFARDRAPVLTIDPGDTVEVRTLDAAGQLTKPSAPGVPADGLLDSRRGHCLAGPIAVRGAEPGMTLAVRVESLRPGDWGYTVAAARDNELNKRLGVVPGDPAWLLWDIEDGLARNNLGFTVRTAPFLGVIGLTPDEPGEHSTVPPRPCGGNIDCRELIAGSTLYLPVEVAGALLCVGDGHAAQGDGEVAGTAIECGMTSRLVVDLEPDPAVATAHAITPAGRITFGFSPDLNEATAQALGAMLDWLQRLFGVDRASALALASPVVDLRVTQVANQTWGVHAVLADGALRR